MYSVSIVRLLDTAKSQSIFQTFGGLHLDTGGVEDLLTAVVINVVDPCADHALEARYPTLFTFLAYYSTFALHINASFCGPGGAVSRAFWHISCCTMLFRSCLCIFIVFWL